MRSLLLASAVLVAASELGPGRRAWAEEAAVRSTTCASYAEHLRAARAYLSRGDRASAVAELRSAQKALVDCANEPTGSASALG